MKTIFTILFFFFSLLTISELQAQIRDSICMHSFTKLNWQDIRKISKAEYSTYISHSDFFTKVYRNDTLFIKLKEDRCLPKTLFVGEYTTPDSVHFIDFIEIKKPQLRACLESICSNFISRNQLPSLRKMSLCTNIDSVKLIAFDLYIQVANGFSTFKILGTDLPLEAQKDILRLKEPQYIIIDNVKILGPDGLRTIEGKTYQIKD